MALRKSFAWSGKAQLRTDDISASVDASVSDTFYCKVETLNGNKGRIDFQVSMTGEITDAKGQKSYSFTPDLASGNFIAQAYEHLKSLDEFSGAQDC